MLFTDPLTTTLSFVQVYFFNSLDYFKAIYLKLAVLIRYRYSKQLILIRLISGLSSMNNIFGSSVLARKQLLYKMVLYLRLDVFLFMNI